MQARHSEVCVEPHLNTARLDDHLRQHARWIRHAGHHEPDPEEGSGGGGNEHAATHSSGLRNVALKAPAPMNTSTAASERGERLASPQTPWPLVQPLPMRVP